jgi:hypothetical protein
MRQTPETFAILGRSLDMDVQRKSDGRSANGRDALHSRVVTVGLPVPYEGVSNALRQTFCPARSDIPADMLELLGKLDRI